MVTRPKRHGWMGGGLGIAAVLGVILLFPGSSVAGIVQNTVIPTTLKAPFSGLEYGYIFDSQAGCGTTIGVPVLPFFNLTTGQAHASVKETAKSCGTKNGSADVEAFPELLITSFTTTAGLHHIVARWVATFSVALAASAGSSPQQAEAGFGVSENLELLDLTSGSNYVPSVLPIVSVYILTGTYSHTYMKVHQTDYLNVTLSSTDSYEMFVDLVATTYVFVTPGTCTASASLNIGSGSNHGVLSSVTGL
jgi:hypothetical protein